MTISRVHWPVLVTGAACIAMLLHGPIAQLAHYHDFADQSVAAGIPHAADVLSNIGFLLVGAWGLAKTWPQRMHPSIAAAWPGYALFMTALVFTAFGSGFYHLAPDNGRLVWDRLPIALACAGLLAAVRADNVPGADALRAAAWLSACAIASVAWWYVTEQAGSGDLRPYLLLQGLPLILIPMWQTIYRAPRADRLAFGTALALYVVAKAAELNDQRLLDALGVVSGHTLKHLLATAAAGVIVARLAARAGPDGSPVAGAAA
jgi:hypothetical protein